MLAAILSSLAQGFGLVSDKIALSRDRISLKVFLPILFIFLFGLTLILVPAFGRLDPTVALLPNTLFLLLVMVLMAVASNALYYEGIQRKEMHHHELMMMLLPIITIVLAAIFYPENLDWRIFILAVISSLAIIFAKGQKEHFFVDATSYNTFLAVILMAGESIVIRELLYSFTPVMLYAIRTFFVSIFFFLYYRPRYNQVSAKHWWLIFVSALLGVIQVIGRYYAYSELGIIYTTMLTALAPIVVFLASWEIMHERIRARVVISAVIILSCITIATAISFGH